VEHLYELGHRNIAYIDLSHPTTWLRGNEHYSIADRHDGYLHAMTMRGLAPQVWMPETQLSVCERIRFLRSRYQATGSKPTALISYGHQVETAFLAAEERLSVPGDLSMISFGGEPQHLNDRTSTQVFLPYQQLGQTAVEQLLVRIRGEQAASIALPLKVLPGESTAAPRGR
jgi:DNA-binding LacI/PurR family transcriptional regulator